MTAETHTFQCVCVREQRVQAALQARGRNTAK
jgi:hypothetical protein